MQDLIKETKLVRENIEKINKNMNILVIFLVWIPLTLAVIYGFYIGLKASDIL
jgi:hypothetical protein